MQQTYSPVSSKFLISAERRQRYLAYPPEFQVLNVFSTAGASILAIGYLLPIVYFIWSLR